MDSNIKFGGIGKNSRAFALRLRDARLFRREADGSPIVREEITRLTVSFRGIGTDDWLLLEDLATLALVIRAVAEAGKTVQIILPPFREGKPSRAQRFLERLGFLDLLSGTGTEGEWENRVTILGDRHHISFMPLGGAFTSYLPMQWFGSGQFSFPKDAAIWRVRPQVAASLERSFQEALHARGVVDSETIALLCHSMFSELGWNVVLHSDREPGAGIGVFCGQVTFQASAASAKPPELTFCIADAGRGIPNTLRAAYRAAETDSQSSFHLAKGVSENTAIVAFALDPASTSRPVMPSEVDREGFRGLATVAAALRGIGQMRIRSEGGAVHLVGRAEGVAHRFEDVLHDAPIIGTQIIGTLKQQTHIYAPTAAVPVRIAHLPLSLNLVCDFDGECPQLVSEDAAKGYVSTAQMQEEAVVFDLGYTDDTERRLEYLCTHLLAKSRGKWLIFWNVATPWTQFSRLQEMLEGSCREVEGLPALFVRGHGDARLIGKAKLAGARGESATRRVLREMLSVEVEENGLGAAVAVSAEDFARLTSKINSNYLASGFDTACRPGADPARSGASGFFVGKIHLLRGNSKSLYFSLTRNLAFAREANLRRWTEACAAAVLRLLERRPDIPEEKLVLLGFTGTVRELVAQVFTRLGRPKCRAYMILTFDIPTREGIASKVHPEDEVLFVTDVISTGTLAESMYTLVSRVGGRVAGIVSLVDTRRKTTAAESIINFDRTDIPLIACGQLSEIEMAGVESTGDEYWVDPVSLIPSREKSWGWAEEVDEKIENTLQLISEADAAICGHVVDGTRHTSLYVDLRKLLEMNELRVQSQIRDVCVERLEACKWVRARKFKPAIVLFPSGISRIESVSTRPFVRGSPTENLTVYQTAVTTYIDRFKKIFPGQKIVPVEVQRAFDPGGGSRCAHTVELPPELEGNLSDVIIADDGIWRGTTVAALTQLAIALGAKRILVAPLLARLSPAEAEQLESLQSVRSARGQGEVKICYAFPLLLPVPYYGVQECPYEITINRINDRRSRIPVIMDIAKRVVRTLEGHTPTDCPKRPAAYRNTWARLRTYVELASDHERALEKLRNIIERASGPDELLALFFLFSDEWRLLGRSRLRQAISPLLRKRAVEAALAPGTSDEVRVGALTVLRSLFKDAFVDHLAEVADLVLKSTTVLERVVLQVSTLREVIQQREPCIRFLEKVSDWSPSSLPNSLEAAQVEQYFSLAAACKVLSLTLRVRASANGRTLRASAVELLHFLRNDPTLLHTTRVFFEILADNTPATLCELGKETFESYVRKWESEHESLLSVEVLPRLMALHLLLLRTATSGNQMLPRKFAFLESEVGAVKEDLASIYQGLSWLRYDPRSRFFAEAVIQASRRFLDSLLGPESATLKLLEKLRKEGMRSMAESFEGAIRAHFSARRQPAAIIVEGLSNIDPNAAIFAPPDVISACTDHVLANLLAHAFPLGSSNSEPRVALCFEEHRNEHGEPMALLLVKNNGRSITTDVQISASAKRAQSNLHMFGGQYSAPRHTDEVPWHVVHSISFLLW